MFEKSVGEFTVSVSEPFPYWIEIEHEYAEGSIKFEHEQLDDLIYALTQAAKHIATSRERAAHAMRLAKEER